MSHQSLRPGFSLLSKLQLHTSLDWLTLVVVGVVVVVVVVVAVVVGTVVVVVDVDSVCMFPVVMGTA